MYDRPFRWWVQSVMPLVFDDSLSYYEVLAKLTKYIEGLTGDVEQIEKVLETIEGIEDISQFTEFLESIQRQIGNLENLQTQTKTSLVSAINEVALKADIAYFKPPTGIPESDLSEEVRNKLNNVGATEYIINNNKLKPAPSNNSPSDLGLGTYSVPTGGIPWDTLSSDVQERINAGGSGGTNDYGNLNNKPQIGGNTLNAGNNTYSELGIGTYTKPESGIPESDLSAEVQEKLNTSGGITDSEDTFVASRRYEAGELVYINGVLYKTKYVILPGTNMVPGVNIEVTDINSELERINSEIEALQSGSGPDSWSLVANLTSDSTVSYVNFFEYFNAIGGENYLFICTPDSGNESPYEISILKRDGTVAYTSSGFSSINQERFTFTPVDTGEYYCRIRKVATTPVTESNASVRVELEYTQSQGMTELWNKVNQAIELGTDIPAIQSLLNQLQERVSALEVTVGSDAFVLDEHFMRAITYPTLKPGGISYDSPPAQFGMDFITELIPLPTTIDGKIYTNACAYGNYRSILYYDSDGEIVGSGTHSSPTVIGYDIPSGATHFRLCARANEGLKLQAYFNLTIDEKANYLCKLMGVFPDISNYDFELKDILTIEHTEINTTTGDSAYSSSSNYVASDFIPLPKNISIIGSYAYTASGRARVAFYREDLSFISALYSTNKRLIAFNIPEGAYFVRFGDHAPTIATENCLAFGLVRNVESNDEIIDEIRQALV